MKSYLGKKKAGLRYAGPLFCAIRSNETYLFISGWFLFLWKRHLAAMSSWLDPGFHRGRRHSHKEETCFADEPAPTVMPRLERFDNAAL
jgi:hypothetical protein